MGSSRISENSIRKHTKTYPLHTHATFRLVCKCDIDSGLVFANRPEECLTSLRQSLVNKQTRSQI